MRNENRNGDTDTGTGTGTGKSKSKSKSCGHTRNRAMAATAALFTGAFLLTAPAPRAWAQTDAPPEKTEKSGQTEQAGKPEKPGASVTEDPSNPIAKPVEFEDLGAAISKVAVKVPAGAALLRQATAPLGENGETLLINVYKLNNVVFADLLTSKSGQAYTRRNHLRLKSPLAVRPGKMVLTLRHLEPQRRRGYLLLAADDAGTLALVFPKGFAGGVLQQNFLASSTDKIKRSYDFSQADSRGFVIVKANVESTGEVKPAEDGQIYVWNGVQFIKRRGN